VTIAKPSGQLSCARGYPSPKSLAASLEESWAMPALTRRRYLERPNLTPGIIRWESLGIQPKRRFPADSLPRSLMMS
jgi:hypothetical protein